MCGKHFVSRSGQTRLQKLPLVGKELNISVKLQRLARLLPPCAIEVIFYYQTFQEGINKGACQTALTYRLIWTNI